MVHVDRSRSGGRPIGTWYPSSASSFSEAVGGLTRRERDKAQSDAIEATPLPGRHAPGLATHRSMSDSRQPAPLTLILIWAGNLPPIGAEC